MALIELWQIFPGSFSQLRALHLSQAHMTAAKQAVTEICQPKPAKECVCALSSPVRADMKLCLTNLTYLLTAAYTHIHKSHTALLLSSTYTRDQLYRSEMPQQMTGTCYRYETSRWAREKQKRWSRKFGRISWWRCKQAATLSFLTLFSNTFRRGSALCLL